MIHRQLIPDFTYFLYEPLKISRRIFSFLSFFTDTSRKLLIVFKIQGNSPCWLLQSGNCLLQCYQYNSWSKQLSFFNCLFTFCIQKSQFCFVKFLSFIFCFIDWFIYLFVCILTPSTKVKKVNKLIFPDFVKTDSFRNLTSEHWKFSKFLVIRASKEPQNLKIIPIFLKHQYS